MGKSDSIQDQSEEFADKEIREIGKRFYDMLDSLKDEDFVVNREQLGKLIAVHTFFAKLAMNGHGKLDKHELKPHEMAGYVTATYNLVDITGDDIKNFSEILSYCSAINIFGLLTGEVCIDVVIPDVFVMKEN